jgi:AraC-like DNA-binding protein
VAGVSTERLSELLPALRVFQEERPGPEPAGRLITGVVRALCAGPPPLRAPDERITRALAFIKSRDVRGLRLEDVAKSVFLSPSRFAHLFSDELGLPFRRYLLWRKLSRAMQEFARGSNLSESAHAAGFADSAHLTRTWLQMFGITPTVMLGRATFYEIPAPFELQP